MQDINTTTPILIKGNTINATESVSFLVINIDVHLSFNKHNLSLKICYQMRVLGKVLSSACLIYFYHTLVQSRLMVLQLYK